jgi:hypothetical protein
VVWYSSIGVDALIAGIPVICHAPYWVCKSAAFGPDADVENLDLTTIDRQAAMERLAYHQWSIVEIASGKPFEHLLQTQEVAVQ